MSRPKILRVWGKADSFDVEFSHKGGTKWQCFVPPDTKDGQYAAEIWAINEYGELAYWTGELYMCSGVCCLRFNDSPYRMWVKTTAAQIGILTLCSDMQIKENSVRIGLAQATQITVRKGCAHVSR